MFVCLFVLKKSFFFFFYFISFFFSKNFLTLMTKYVHSYHFIWLCWIQEVLQLYLTCKVIILIYCYRQCLCFSVFFYSNLHLLQLSCSNAKTIRSAVICVFAVAVWIHLVVLWLCDRGRGSAHNVGLALRFDLFQTKTGPFPSLKSQNVKCEQNDNNDEKWKPTCYCWRVKDWPDWLPPGLFFFGGGGGGGQP